VACLDAGNVRVRDARAGDVALGEAAFEPEPLQPLANRLLARLCMLVLAPGQRPRIMLFAGTVVNKTRLPPGNPLLKTRPQRRLRAATAAWDELDST
jgi:hypothetical protein